jgi:uncharacterized SAM-binding protein YcdF (DUF218 family)
MRVNRRVVFVATLLGLGVLVVMGVLYYDIDSRSQQDRARPADTIIILGAAVWSGERAGPSLAARAQHAITLYHAGYASHLILSGGLGKYPPSEAEMMRRILTAAGVPEAALVLEDGSHSTEENLANSKRIMNDRGWHNALIVSDPFHLYRAELIAQDLGLEAYGSPAPNSPNSIIPVQRLYYTWREAGAIVWYYGIRIFGEPVWLYRLLKGNI